MGTPCEEGEATPFANQKSNSATQGGISNGN